MSSTRGRMGPSRRRPSEPDVARAQRAASSPAGESSAASSTSKVTRWAGGSPCRSPGCVQIRVLLRERHRLQPGTDDDFSIRNLSELASAQEEGTRTLTTGSWTRLSTRTEGRPRRLPWGAAARHGRVLAAGEATLDGRPTPGAEVGEARNPSHRVERRGQFNSPRIRPPLREALPSGAYPAVRFLRCARAGASGVGFIRRVRPLDAARRAGRWPGASARAPRQAEPARRRPPPSPRLGPRRRGGGPTRRGSGR